MLVGCSGSYFGPERDEATADGRKSHNEELYDLYISPGIGNVIRSRRMRQMGRVACVGEKRNAYSVLVGKPEGNLTTFTV
jgi:hypothetical protein